MKRFGPIVIAGLVLAAVLLFFIKGKDFHLIRAKSEWVETFSPDASSIAANEWIHLPFGVTIAWFPLKYAAEPVWVSIPYQPGPPKHFIGHITMHLQSGEIELTVDGPLTIDKTLGDADWKQCFESWFKCSEAKQKALDLLLRDFPALSNYELSWFQNRNKDFASGIRIHFEKNKMVWDKVAVVSPLGAFTVLTFKRPKHLTNEADQTFEQVVQSLQSRDLQQLGQAQAEIALLISSVRLNAIQQITDLKQRMGELSKAQVLLASNLSVQPNLADPFFHFGGVSHMLGIQLLNARERIFTNQEAWSNYAEPNLQAMALYLNDFEKSTREQKNLEELIKDLAYQRQKLLRRK